MQRDIRETPLYREAESLLQALRQPGTGLISDATELNVAPDGERAVFAGVIVDTLQGSPSTRICLTDLTTGDTRVLTFGPNSDRLPKFSPDAKHIAFLSDRHKAGDSQLYLLNPASRAARPTPHVEGWVEYLHWSPDGQRILLGVAGHGADVGGVQGAVSSKPATYGTPSWMPKIETGDESYRWRRAFVYELAGDRVRQVSRADINIWEANWCANGAITAVVSKQPEEGHWYSACLSLIDTQSGATRELFAPKDQIGWPSASPSGKHVAIVEAICSDRWFVAGDLHLIEAASAKRTRIDTQNTDITYTEWRSDQTLLLAGHRGFETVVGFFDLRSNTYREIWSHTDRTTPGIYASVSGYGDTGDCALITESFAQAPEIAVIHRGECRPVKSFDVGNADVAKVIAAAERVTWKAPDGLEIQGWLLIPHGQAPFPLVMNVHGGPVFHWRPRWLGRAAVSVLMLLKRGHAVFFPNPRGSSGRGQVFAGKVVGDLGGAETLDHLSGLDHLTARGFADPQRLGVMGISHGGFMSSWIITQDARFRAAVPLCPVTNYVAEHLIGNIPHYVRLFLQDKYTNPIGRYFQRSPVMHAHKVKTPTLNICGMLDRCTPPEEAVQFHNALLENEVKSVLVTYPEEGHGVRKWPAAIDYAARVVGWFEEHLGRAV